MKTAFTETGVKLKGTSQEWQTFVQFLGMIGAFASSQKTLLFNNTNLNKGSQEILAETYNETLSNNLEIATKAVERIQSTKRGLFSLEVEFTFEEQDALVSLINAFRINVANSSGLLKCLQDGQQITDPHSKAAAGELMCYVGSQIISSLLGENI